MQKRASIGHVVRGEVALIIGCRFDSRQSTSLLLRRVSDWCCLSFAIYSGVSDAAANSRMSCTPIAHFTASAPIL
jgi:hypothetical protein